MAREIPVDPDRTLFRIGSVAKLFVWTAVMQLVEQGKLDVHADVQQYLDFELPAQLLGASRGSVAPPITLMHLMTHSAGFEDVATDLFHLYEEHTMSLEHYIRTHVPARVFAPGEVSAYSNYGSALAGYIVQRVSGMPFEQYVEEHIFAPLRMSNSTFRQPVEDRLAADVARGYRRIDGEFVEGAFVYGLGPAGGMSSTALDMARFMLAHLQDGVFDGRRILTEETVRTMRNRLFSQHERLDGMAYGFMEYTVNGRRALMHAGGVLLFNSALFLLPEEGVGLFVSYSGGGYFEPTDLFLAFMDKYYPVDGVGDTAAAATAPARSGEPTAVASVGAHDTRRIVGEYHINRRSFTTDEGLLSLLETLHVNVDDQGRVHLTRLGQTTTFVPVAPGVYRNVDPRNRFDPYGTFSTIVFQEGADGRMLLLADGPMSYSKAPLHLTSGFTVGAIVASVLMFAGSLVVWMVRGLIRRGKDWTSAPVGAKAARVAASLFGVIALGFLGGLLIAAGDMDPAFGVPKSFFGIEPTWASSLHVAPILLLALAGLMVIFTVVAWARRFWSVGARVHYTVLTMAAAMLLAVLKNWHLI